MIFTLEALQAKHGDSLLLHYGAKADPQLIVIDGGPPAVFDMSLRPRLEELQGKRCPSESLPVRMMMVSHIDDDHIGGILNLTDALIEQDDGPDPKLCDITTLWHNSFEDMLGHKAQASALPASLTSTVKVSAAGDVTFPPGLFSNKSSAAIAASVPQGKRLKENADVLSFEENEFFEDLVSLAEGTKKPLVIDGKLKFWVLGPSQTRLDKLKKDWQKKLAELKQKPPAQARSLAAEFIDKSVYNLSSIIVLAELGKKRMLLTGDALSADILAGLRETGLLKSGGTLAVDILKLPHHGSRRNVTEEFLSTVTADHYVISANGRDHNPDVDTLKMLSKVRGSTPCTIHLTNPVPHAVAFFKRDMNKAGKKYKLNIRKDPALSIRVDLGDPFTD
jgi:hypothetical protein